MCPQLLLLSCSSLINVFCGKFTSPGRDVGRVADYTIILAILEPAGLNKRTMSVRWRFDFSRLPPHLHISFLLCRYVLNLDHHLPPSSIFRGLDWVECTLGMSPVVNPEAKNSLLFLSTRVFLLMMGHHIARNAVPSLHHAGHEELPYDHPAPGYSIPKWSIDAMLNNTQDGYSGETSYNQVRPLDAVGR